MLSVLLLMSLIPRCPAEGKIVSDFGRRQDPITGRRRFHSGIDIAAVKGTEIRAMWDGVVTLARPNGGYGNMVEIQHGTLKIRYAHCTKMLVREGDIVLRGDVVATVGETGRATGPHLHLEAKRGRRKIDPEPLTRICTVSW